MKAWFVSDIHIQNPGDPKCALFEKFLAARLHDGTTHLFLVGDIFDLWVGGDRFFQERYQSIVSGTQALVRKGVKVLYFEGNHDLHLDSFWERTLGVEVHTGPAYFHFGPEVVRVEHGDQMNPDDRGYLFLRAVLRTPVLRWLANTLPGRWIQAIGDWMSRTSRTWTAGQFQQYADRVHGLTRAHAKKVYAEKPFGLIVTGHVHVRDDYEFELNGKKVRTINLGTWIDSEPMVLAVDATDSTFAVRWEKA